MKMVNSQLKKLAIGREKVHIKMKYIAELTVF
jgi:hypothetical protein